MKRKKDYFRYQRMRAIRKKYGILVRIYGKDSAKNWYKGKKNALSKNKIHCSCSLCRMKSYDDWKFRDRRIMETMKLAIKDFYNGMEESVWGCK